MSHKLVKSGRSATGGSARGWFYPLLPRLKRGLWAFLFLAFLPTSGFAQAQRVTYYLDITTNWPGSDYTSVRNALRSSAATGAKWGIENYDQVWPTNNHGWYVDFVGEAGNWTIVFRTMTNFYTPTNHIVALDPAGADLPKTNYYIPFSNCLAVAITGTNAMNSNIVWSFSSYPANEFPHSSAYSNNVYTNNMFLTPVPTGNYAVVFPSVSGYNTIASTSVNFTTSVLTNYLTGTYVRALGTIVITNVSPTNGSWSFTSSPSDFTNFCNLALVGTNNSLLTNMPVGIYKLHFNSIGSPYIAPADSTQTNTPGTGNTNLTFLGTYTIDTQCWLSVYFQPAAILDTARWRISSETNWLDYLTDAHVVVSQTYLLYFSAVKDYYLPSSYTVSNIFGDRTVTNTYVPYTNSLSVVVTGITDGSSARWSITSPSEFTNSSAYSSYYTGSQSLSPIPTGSYSIVFSNVSGYTTPANITTNIVQANNPTVTGAYQRILGHLRISMTPSAAASNAPWILSSYPSDLTLYTNKLDGIGNYTYSNIPIGSYTVTFQELTGYSTPSPNSGTLYSNTTTVITGAYTFLGHTLVVHIGAPLTRQSSLEGIGSGPCEVRYGDSVSTQSAVSATYSVNDDDTVTLTALTNYVYKWYLNAGGGSAAGIDSLVSFSNTCSFVMDQDYDVWLLYSTPYNSYDHAGDIDHDQLPDVWEVKWFPASSWISEAITPQAETPTNTYSNPDNDFISSVSTNPPVLVSVSNSGVVVYSGAGGSTPGYPLKSTRLCSHQEASIPAARASALGYSTGLKFNNYLECRGLDGYYLTNGPSGWVPSDDPLTSPSLDDTDSDSLTDGWEYYFWYWRSSAAYSAGLTNTSANLSWVTFRPTTWDMNDNDSDGDEFIDLEEHDDCWTDPTHCDTDADSMDDLWEVNFDSAVVPTNVFDNSNGSANPDGDFMAVVTNTVLVAINTYMTNAIIGTVLGTNVYWYGNTATNPNAAWQDIYTNKGFNRFDLYHDTVIKASPYLTNGVVGTVYAYTSYYGMASGLGNNTYRDNSPVWVDVDNSGTYSAGDYALVNPRIKHDGVYRLAPSIPLPGVCSFDPRTAWTNGAAYPNTEPYTTYQEYLGGDYIGHLSWDAGGKAFASDSASSSRDRYTWPNSQDTDSDLMPGGWELYTGLDPNSSGDAGTDSDGDGLFNWEEWANATHSLNSCSLTWTNKPWPTDPGFITAPNPNDPHPADTDWDGITDGGEKPASTNEASNPTDYDTDGDALPDGWEKLNKTSVTASDANLDLDFDGLMNWQEYWTGTVPEWQYFKTSLGTMFLSRWCMDWNPPAVVTTNDPYEVVGTAPPYMENRFFIPPDWATCPAFLYANHAWPPNVAAAFPNNSDRLNWLRGYADTNQFPRGFPAAQSKGVEGGTFYYYTTRANMVDTDGDGLDDFWEVFHCLDPLRGYNNVHFHDFRHIDNDPLLRVGAVDADPSTPDSYEVGTMGHPFTNNWDTINYIRTWEDSISSEGSALADDSMVMALIGPHNFGLSEMDPDSDGLPNIVEYSYHWSSARLHTCPSPLWRTSPYGYWAYGNYRQDNTPHFSMWSILGFSRGASCMCGCRPHWPFRFAVATDGFDTDNDLINDYDEITGHRSDGTVVAGSDPLNDESPLRNRVLWLDGTNSYLRSNCWPPITDYPGDVGDFTKFSVEAWARPSRLISAWDQVIVEKTSGYNLQKPDGTFINIYLANFQLGISANGFPYVLFHDQTGLNTNRALAAQVGLIQVEKWAHLAGTFDGSNLVLYVNGEACALHHTTDIPAWGDEGNSPADYIFWDVNPFMSIGARTPNGTMFGWVGENFFAGCIDEVRVWDRVLSVGEINARRNRRLTPAEVGLILPGNTPFSLGANRLFSYYRFTDLPDPNVDGVAPSGYPRKNAVNALIPTSSVYTNYSVIARDMVKKIPRIPSMDTRVINGSPIATDGPPNSTNEPDDYGISVGGGTNYLNITLYSDFRNSANPYRFMHPVANWDVGGGMWLYGRAQGIRTNIWLPTLDPNNPDSSDTDGDGLPDWWEQQYGLDINDATGDNGAWGDLDNDGLNNRAEYLAGTSPINSDTNGDGIGDYDSRSGPYTRTWGEMYMDGDGMPDTWEIAYGLDPYHYDANQDKDGDGWSNYAEYQAGTDPNSATSFPTPRLLGTAQYFGDKDGTFRSYTYNTNTMDGTPQITEVSAGYEVAETLGTADGSRLFFGTLPVFPLDVTTVIRIYARAGSSNVTFTFTSPETYTYSGIGSDYGANVNYTAGWIALRWSNSEVPVAGTPVYINYTYVNRNAALFLLGGFKEGDFYMLSLLDVNGNKDYDAGEPLGTLEDQPLWMGISTINNVRIHVKDSSPGYGRFNWKSTETATNDFPVVLTKISEGPNDGGAPTVLTRTMRWPRYYFHEWDYQLAGFYGLDTGTYQWWMNKENGTFQVTWPASVSTPYLVYPRGELLNYARNQFQWMMDSYSTRYHLQVARQNADRSLTMVLDQYYPTPFCDKNGVSQANLPKYAGELGNGIYYWRVASWSPVGESAWSETQTFEVDLTATNSHWISGNLYYFGKADSSNIYVEAFNNKGFSGIPEARILLNPTVSRSEAFKGSFTIRGLQGGTYYVRAFLDVTPAGGSRDGKRNYPWESWGFIRDPNNNYQPRTITLLNTMFMDGTTLTIRDQDTDNDLLPDAWEMFYFGNLDQTGDMDYDGDGETNLEEYMRDGYDMNPAYWDSDGDGLSDAFEFNYTAPSFGYSAKSGQKLDPNLWDTDGDGYSDGAELKRYHTNPLDPNSYPLYRPMCFDAWRSPGDYDGDGRSDLGVYDINSGNWYLLTAGGFFYNLVFGTSATQPMLGDFTGDGCDDFAVYGPSSGTWYLFDAWSGQSFSTRYGDSEMIPVPADYSGDGKTDLAVYYPAEGTWFIYNIWNGNLFTLTFGGPSWTPVPADYNGDGATDLGVYEASSGNWQIFAFHLYARQSQYLAGTFGGPTLIPVSGDYDGDGRSDIALFDSSTANWYILTWKGQFLSGQFGCYGCVPVAGDYDGDGRTDVCIYYPPTGMWYILCWSGQSYQVQFGYPAARPALKGR